jgi:hypothetical protein
MASTNTANNTQVRSLTKMEKSGEWLAECGDLFRKLSPTQKKFLNAYPECLTIAATARKVGITTKTHHWNMKHSNGYRRCFEALKDYVVVAMEEEAIRRATRGVREDIFYQGEKCGEKRVYSDGLLMFMLKAARPDVYRERVSIDDMTTLNTDSPNEYGDLSKEALMEIRKVIDADINRRKVVQITI